MLARRIIPCLDVRAGKVVKGIRFQNHRVMGEIVELAKSYREQGADELVFYDITASPEGRSVDRLWVSQVAEVIDIPFCVAGGIRTVEDARAVLGAGADKLSLNSPALENPGLISQLADEFGSQCITVGIDSLQTESVYRVRQYSGDPDQIMDAGRLTEDWLAEVQDRGAGEIVLNCINHDGVRTGFDLPQLSRLRDRCQVPLIASGGAGEMQHFSEVFSAADVDGALAATVFHSGQIKIPLLKSFLHDQGIETRL
jgi:cyclase